MNKQAFIHQLRNGLSGLPQDEIEQRLNFYSEMIDDRMEEGLSEIDAVCAIGPVETIIAQILADVPLTKQEKAKPAPKKKRSTWEITLLILGSPVWFSLLIAVFAVILSLYVSVWSVVGSLWAVFGSLVSCVFGCTIAGIAFVCCVNGISGFAMISASLICAGLSIFMFFGCKAITKGTVILTKKLALGVKNCFVKGEA